MITPLALRALPLCRGRNALLISVIQLKKREFSPPSGEMSAQLTEGYYMLNRILFREDAPAKLGQRVFHHIMKNPQERSRFSGREFSIP